MVKLHISYDGRYQGHAFDLIINGDTLKLLRVPDGSDERVNSQLQWLCDQPGYQTGVGICIYNVTPEVVQHLNALQLLLANHPRWFDH